MINKQDRYDYKTYPVAFLKEDIEKESKLYTICADSHMLGLQFLPKRPMIDILEYFGQLSYGTIMSMMKHPNTEVSKAAMHSAAVNINAYTLEMYMAKKYSVYLHFQHGRLKEPFGSKEYDSINIILYELNNTVAETTHLFKYGAKETTKYNDESYLRSIWNLYRSYLRNKYNS